MTLKDLIMKHAELFQKFRHTAHEITSDTVFQEGNAELQATMEAVISSLLEPDSRVIGSEHLFTLLEKVKAGKRCLILPEHYSNFDYPLITLLFKRLGEKGEELSKRLVAMAGIKLSEENDMISMMNTAYDRITVYPGRSLQAITDPEILELETKKARAINIASMRMMEELRANGRVVVVFPTGTRYRPGKPETKKAIREIDSYIKTSDYLLLLSINGNCLEVSTGGDMTADVVKKDTIILQASEVIDCKKFREEIAASLQEGEDKKQKLADTIMSRLEVMHMQNENAKSLRRKIR